MHGHRCPREGSVIGDFAASGDSTGIRHVGMNHIEHSVVEVWAESFDKFDLLARKQGYARRAFELKPRFRIANRQRIFDKYWIDCFDGLA